MEVSNMIVTLLTEALESGITVFLDGEKLKFKLTKGKEVDPTIINKLKKHKSEIISFLSDELADFHGISNSSEHIVAFDRTEVKRIPLSFSQQRLWFIDKFDEGSTHYHMPFVQRMDGSLDIAILTDAFRTIVNRHEALRTVFKEEEGRVFQYILAENEWNLDVDERLDLVGEAAKDQLDIYVQEEISRTIDLSKDHMLRAKLLKLSEEEYLLIIVMHHIASDGWSSPIFLSFIKLC